MSKNVIFMHFALMCLTCDTQVKVSRAKVKGHMSQGQRLNWLRSNKGSKQRQVGSHQRQVASFWYDTEYRLLS